MPKAAPIQQSFLSGEISPLFKGQANTDVYRSGVDELKNWLPTPQGALTRRMGASFAYKPTLNEVSALIPFIFSEDDTYIIRLGSFSVDILKNAVFQVNIATPYTNQRDLVIAQYAQNGDNVFIVHPEYAPRTLTRTSDTVWAFDLVTNLFNVEGNGPYLPINDDTTHTVTPSAVGPGVVTLTASSALWASTDVGRQMRIQDSGGNWTWGTITFFTSSTSVLFNIKGAALADLTARSTWRLGLYSDTTGYPGTIAFHEDRLVLGGPPTFPLRVDFSRPGIYNNFEETEADGTVNDDNSISLTMNAREFNRISWMETDERGLLVGTLGGEWLITGSIDNEALTPTNVAARQFTTFGSRRIQAQRVGKFILAPSVSGMKMRQIGYTDNRGGFDTRTLSELSEHILRTERDDRVAAVGTGGVQPGGVVETAHQQEPFSQIFMPLTDGSLISALFTSNLQENETYGPARIEIGGIGGRGSDTPEVESVAVVNAENNDRSVVYMIVRRFINGASGRYIEYFSPEFENGIEQEDANYLDSSVTHNVSFAVNTATQANPVVISTGLSAHGYSNGDKVRIRRCKGMTEINGDFFVANVTATTFELQTAVGVNLDGTSFGNYSFDSGEVRKFVSSVSGLTHLEGETVSVVADGIVQSDKTVSSGAITLDNDATIIHVGYKYNSDVKLLPFDFGSATGTALAKTQRIHRIGLSLYRTNYLSLGGSFDNLVSVRKRPSSLAATVTDPVFTGITTQTTNINYEKGNSICIRVSDPLPATILAVMPMLHTQDR